MMFSSDALMIGLVFFLLFGAVALYLYLYVQQVDQKVNLLESILLDMKVSHELKSFEVPAADSEHASYVPFMDNTVVEISSAEELTPFVDADEVDDTPQVQVGNTQSTLMHHDFDVTDVDLEPSLNYETATLKELQAAAKAKGISVSNMKKSQVIEALKGVEQSGLPQGSSSFLETSAPVSNDQ